MRWSLELSRKAYNPGGFNDLIAFQTKYNGIISCTQSVEEVYTRGTSYNTDVARPEPSGPPARTETSTVCVNLQVRLTTLTEG